MFYYHLIKVLGPRWKLWFVGTCTRHVECSAPLLTVRGGEMGI